MASIISSIGLKRALRLPLGRNVLEQNKFGSKLTRNAVFHSWRTFSSTPAVPTKDASGSTNTAHNPSTVVDSEKDVVVDGKGKRWLKQVDKDSGEVFYYNEETWETVDSIDEVSKIEKPKYSTGWQDDRFPSWVQFLDTSSMRKYYYNLSDGQVTWAPPDKPDLNIFLAEYEKTNRPMTQVPSSVPNAPLGRRTAAAMIDLAASGLFVSALTGMFYFELGDLMGASAGAGFFGLGSFMARDAVFEKGTRSLGKRFMKLEVVTMNGELPSRWNTAFRSITTPLYMGMFVPELIPYTFAFATLDVASLLFTPNNMRLGDWAGRTRVIQEQEDREARMEEKEERDLEADREKPMSLE